MSRQRVEWDLKKPVAERTQKKTRTSKEPVHTIFLDMCGYTDDSFWINILTRASQGKMEKGFSFNGGIFSHKKGFKTSSMVLSNDPPHALLQVKEFMKAYGNIMSANEIHIVEEDQEEQTHWYDGVNSLSDITCKKTKDRLITEFVATQKNEQNLTQSEKGQLSETIFKALLRQDIGYSDFLVSDGLVVFINKLYFDPAEREYFIHGQGVGRAKTEKRAAVTNKDYIEDAWKKQYKSIINGKKKTGASARFAAATVKMNLTFNTPHAEDFIV